MRSLFLVFLAILTLESQAQEIKKMVEYHDSKGIREEYYVLKASPKIKHGPYNSTLFSLKLPLETGYYKNNLKDSVWAEYLPRTIHIMKEGYYQNDKKNGIWRECTYENHTIFLSGKGAYKDDVRVGLWQFFNPKGEIKEVFDFSRDTLLFVKPPADSIEFDVLIDNVWEKRKLERAPGLIPDKNGNGSLNSISHFIRYPIDAVRNGIEGLVVIAFLINEEGIANNFHVKTKLYPSLDAEALRVAKLINQKFYPGLLNGKPVTTKLQIPIRFAIK